MEPNSTENQQEDNKSPSMKQDIERLKQIDPEFLTSLDQELEKGLPLVEKALHSIKKLELKDMVELKSFMKPPEEVFEVLCALMYLLAGNTPESFIKADEKKNPVDLTWQACKMMLKDASSFFKYTEKVTDWIHEEKITFEMTIPVRNYLEKPWFNVENLKKKSIGAAKIGEFVRNMIEYFDLFREVRAKLRARVKEPERDE